MKGTHTLNKSRLVLEDDLLHKMNKDGSTVASIRLSEISDAYIKASLAIQPLQTLLGCVAGGSAVYFLWDGWFANVVLVLLAIFAFGALTAISVQVLVIKYKGDEMRVVIEDLLEEGQAFLIMINQNR